MSSVTIIQGDCIEVLRTLPAQSVHTCVTSPPYWGLRDYGTPGQFGLEPSPDEYVARMVEVFREVRRVLRDDGTVWLNLGDSYVGAPGGWQGKNGQRASRTFTARIDVEKGGGDLKPKDLCGMPWMIAFALRADGWYLRQDIIWSKPNPMPESTRDRCTKAHEYIFLLSKAARYYYDQDAIAEPVSPSMLAQMEQGYDGTATKDYAGAGAQDPSTTKTRIIETAKHRQLEKQASTRRMMENTQWARDAGWHHDSPFGLSRNKRSVWTIATHPYPDAHFATFPPALIEPCIKAGCPVGGTVLDPFGGAGTTGLVADRLQRNAILIELNGEYAEMARRRIHADGPLLASVEVRT